MRITLKKTLLMALSLVLLSAMSAFAASKKIYSEIEFLDTFGGKTQKIISGTLGEPVKKQMSVKPSGAKKFMQRTGAGKEDKSKKVKVEMWYYNDIVTYDGKRTYKEVEITFVNNRAGNIAFFNNR